MENPNIPEQENERLVKQFNELFPVGSTVLWRSVADDAFEHKPFKVEAPAFLSNGNPVAFLESKSSYVSISPAFVDYVSSKAHRTEFLRQRILELEKIKIKAIKPFYEEYDQVCTGLHILLGENAYFQSEKTIFKTVIPDGKFVKFERYGIVRTRFEGETKGSLSMKEAREAGFTVEEK